MRITQRAIALTSLKGLNQNLTTLAKMQERLTSGKQFSKASESPTGANISMQTRTEMRATEQHARNIADATARLNQTDTTLQTMNEMTRRVRDLTLQAKSTGNSSVTSREAIAKEVAALRDGLIGLANQTVNGTPLFGGITGGTTAYDPTTGAWVGNNTATVERRLTSTETVRIDVSGPEAFGTPGDDLFAVAGRIAADAPTNPAALTGHLDDLDAIIEKMTTALADVGARQVRVENAESINSDYQLTLKTALAENEDIDLPKTIMELKMQETGYNAALQATAKTLQPSLMDFLR
jgi:flagellar hook-associated protein 3 FlgL